MSAVRRSKHTWGAPQLGTQKKGNDCWNRQGRGTSRTRPDKIGHVKCRPAREKRIAGPGKLQRTHNVLCPKNIAR